MQINHYTVMVLMLLSISSSADSASGHWSPYLSGALIGLLAAATILFSDRPLGISTAYARIVGLLGLGLAPDLTKRLEYFKQTAPAIEWEVLFFIGVVFGSFLAAWSGNTFSVGLMAPTWIRRFGADSGSMRILFSIIGGILMAFGARLAGGCTSGHGISGTMQRSVGSWIALVCFFIGGMLVAMLIFRSV